MLAHVAFGPIYHPGYYGAFVLDYPDANDVEVVCHTAAPG
jgi:hypothetical protein